MHKTQGVLINQYSLLQNKRTQFYIAQAQLRIMRRWQ